MEEQKIVETETDGGENAEDRHGKHRRRHGRREEFKKARRTDVIQIKVAPNLRNRAEQRAASLDMGLSEYIRFLLFCDIHGYAQTGDGPAIKEED